MARRGRRPVLRRRRPETDGPDRFDFKWNDRGECGFGGEAERSLCNLDFKKGKVPVSGPLSATVAVRLSATVTDRRGTLYNAAQKRFIQSKDGVGFRGSLRWKVKPDLYIAISSDWNLHGPIRCAFSFGLYGPTQRAANRRLPALLRYFSVYSIPSTKPRDRLSDVEAELRASNDP